MDQITHEVQSAQWLNIINQCQKRHADVSVKQWLVDHDISDKSYYYWLRKFRRQAYAELQPHGNGLTFQQIGSEISFAEISLPSQQVGNDPYERASCSQITPVGVIRRGNMSIAFIERIPEKLLSMIIKERLV